LPEDLLEAVSTNCPTDGKLQNSKSDPSKPAAVDSESEDDRLADDESKLLIQYI